MRILISSANVVCSVVDFNYARFTNIRIPFMNKTTYYCSLICKYHLKRPGDDERPESYSLVIIFLQCFQVFFNETVVLSYIPSVCKIIFENQANRKSVPFEEIYVRRMKPQESKRIGPSTIGPKVIMGKKFEFSPQTKMQTPRNVVARENTRNVVFHCITDKDAVTVTWEFDGVLQNAFSGLIYQNAKPLPKNVLTNYRVNSSEQGQHSLTVLEVKPRTTGTYCCSVRFRNVTDMHYRAELVMVTIDEPMTIELLPPGQKWQALFRCVISYYGRMQPFLRCADLSQNMGNKQTTRPGLASVVVFEKYMNLSSFPYSCEIHFRNSKGETTLFESGQTILASRFMHAGINSSRRATVSMCLLVIALLVGFQTIGRQRL